MLFQLFLESSQCSRGCQKTSGFHLFHCLAVIICCLIFYIWGINLLIKIEWVMTSLCHIHGMETLRQRDEHVTIVVSLMFSCILQKLKSDYGLWHIVMPQGRSYQKNILIADGNLWVLKPRLLTWIFLMWDLCSPRIPPFLWWVMGSPNFIWIYHLIAGAHQISHSWSSCNEI